MPLFPWKTRLRLWFQLVGGLFYLLVIAWVLSGLTGHSFMVLAAAVVGGALFCSSLGLAWMTLWAVRKDSRLGQFGIGSLFFLTAFVAIYFAFVRWTVLAMWRYMGALPQPGVLVVAVVSLFVLLLSIPIVLQMTESLLWMAVRFVRCRPVQRLLRKRRESDANSLRNP